MICREFTISGRVQGVWFRAATREQAIRLRLNGHVCNLADGQVRVVACGAPDNVDALRVWLHSGPPHAEVATVVQKELPQEQFSAFEIR